METVVLNRCWFSRFLGLEIDCKLNWNYHVSEIIKSFTQKLNLLKSLYFLPIKAREDFYFKVIIPSVTYGLMIWSSYGKILMDEVEKIHVRAAKVIHQLDWSTPSDQVLTKANWNTIRDRNSKRLLCFAYKCYYGCVPEQLQSFVRKNNYTYDFRRKLSLALPMPKSGYVRNSMSYRAANLWNSLTNEYRALNNIVRFKKMLNIIKF